MSTWPFDRLLATSLLSGVSTTRVFGSWAAHVDLTMDLRGRRHRCMKGAKLHGLDFRY